jgi:hypothetical protein
MSGVLWVEVVVPARTWSWLRRSGTPGIIGSTG